MSLHATRDRASAERLVVRPPARRDKGWRRAAAFMVVLEVLVLFYATQPGVLHNIRGIGLVLGCLLAGLIVVATYVYVRRAYVVVTPTEIGKAGFTGRPRMRPRADVETLVTATMWLRYVGEFSNLFVLDENGRRIMRLRSTHWAVEDMERIAESLGITPVDIPGPVSGPQLAKEYPNAVKGFERRPVFYTGIIIGTLFFFLPLMYALIFVVMQGIQ